MWMMDFLNHEVFALVRHSIKINNPSTIREAKCLQKLKNTLVRLIFHFSDHAIASLFEIPWVKIVPHKNHIALKQLSSSPNVLVKWIMCHHLRITTTLSLSNQCSSHYQPQ